MRRLSQRYGFALATWAVVATMLVVAYQLVRNPTWRPTDVGDTAASAPDLGRLGRPSQLPRTAPSTVGNLISNWSFERDLSGWQVLGPGAIDRIEDGRTSGSAVSLRLVGETRASVAIDYPGAARGAQIGDRYAATVWVRSEYPGLPVAVSVISRGGGRQEVSQVVGHTRTNQRWARIAVTHVVGLPNSEVGLRVQATQLQPDRSVVIDEVMLRRG